MPARLRHLVVVLVGALSLAPLCIDSANAQNAQSAQDYPSRLIKIIVPFPPGGNPDLAARLVAERMSAAFRQPVIIENRAGANGALGASAVAKAEPDGYTLLVTSLGVLAINPAIYDQLSYNPRTDFAPVSRLAISPLLLIAGPSGPIDSVQSLVAAAKKEPGKLTYASSGVGSAAHMAGALFNQVTETELLPFTFRGTADATTELASGNISVAFGGQGVSWPLVDAGKVRALAFTGVKRSPAHPETPTVSEAGIAGYEMADWVGMLAPAGTAQPIVDKLNAEIRKALADPALVQKFVLQGLDPAVTTPQEFSAFMMAEQQKWSAVAKKANIRVQP
jgi:tripartite-type tricarboxylate transporter receptor subunit TctC